MGLNIKQLPPPLQLAIEAQPGVPDGDTAMVYLCGCQHDRTRPTWKLCGRHTNTIHQTGRMLNG